MVLCWLFFVSELRFHLMCVHVVFGSVRLLGGRLLGNGCSHGWPYVLFVY